MQNSLISYISTCRQPRASRTLRAGLPVRELLFPTGVLDVQNLVLKVGLGVCNGQVVDARTDLCEREIKQKRSLEVADLAIQVLGKVPSDGCDKLLLGLFGYLDGHG